MLIKFYEHRYVEEELVLLKLEECEERESVVVVVVSARHKLKMIERDSEGRD
jgi:hypothetical protein